MGGQTPWFRWLCYLQRHAESSLTGASHCAGNPIICSKIQIDFEYQQIVQLGEKSTTDFAKRNMYLLTWECWFWVSLEMPANWFIAFQYSRKCASLFSQVLILKKTKSNPLVKVSLKVSKSRKQFLNSQFFQKKLNEK